MYLWLFSYFINFKINRLIKLIRQVAELEMGKNKGCGTTAWWGGGTYSGKLHGWEQPNKTTCQGEGKASANQL